MDNYHLAQLNIARMLAPIESPQLSDFVANLDRINALAEAADGFVWRLQDEAGSATRFRPFGAEMLVNLTLWNNIESLHNYVYRSGHVEIMKRRKEWFEMMREFYMVLWWVPVGTIPTVDEAKQKLAQLRQQGPSSDAFTFKQPFVALCARESSLFALSTKHEQERTCSMENHGFS